MSFCCSFCNKLFESSVSLDAHHCKKNIEFHKDLKKFVRSQSERIKQLYESEACSGATDALHLLLEDFTWVSSGGIPLTPFLLKKMEANLAEEVRKIAKELGVYKGFMPRRTLKSRETMLERYGVINNGQLPEARQKLSARNKADVYKVSLKTGFEAFKKRVESITQKSKKSLPKPSIDFYTSLPFLKGHSDSFLMQGDLYPTVDHKLSVLYCYLRGISAEECGAPENLVWTYRYLNSLKQHLTEYQFRESLLPLVEPLLKIEVTNLLIQGESRN